MWPYGITRPQWVNSKSDDLIHGSVGQQEITLTVKSNDPSDLEYSMPDELR